SETPRSEPDRAVAVVQHFLGELAPADDASGHAEQQRRASPVQALEGLGGALVSRRRAQQQSSHFLVVKHADSAIGDPPLDGTGDGPEWMCRGFFRPESNFVSGP